MAMNEMRRNNDPIKTTARTKKNNINEHQYLDTVQESQLIKKYY
ncbi:MAG: hypothetical protein JWQ40_203 [Segetibacter sp.]|jgi:hypothetical protein|nr:hypothetical protein [Segetibacter sp.]